MSLQYIETPNNNDILSGRGNFVNYHPGNEHFRALVKKHKVAYVACPKSLKGKFAEMIVEEIKQLDPPGRFLKQDEATKLWYDIGEKKALDKTRQALREGAPEIQKAITVDDDAPAGSSSNKPIVQERRASTGTIVPLSAGNGILYGEGRRISAPTIDPSLLSGIVDDDDHNSDIHLPGQLSSLQQPQQVCMTYQHQINTSGDESNDPYCSTLPPEHYESFNNVSSLNPLNNEINVTSFNSMMAQQMLNNAYQPNVYRNTMSALTTINESQGNGFIGMDTRFFVPNNAPQYHLQNTQHIGQPDITVFQQSNLVQQDFRDQSNRPVVQPYQPNLGVQSNYTRQNQSVNSGNRTYKVRPEPIQIGSTVTTTSEVPSSDSERTSKLSGSLGAPECDRVSSHSHKDVSVNKQRNRCITPRRMIINVQQQPYGSHTATNPTGTIEYGAVRFSPPRASRSRMRGRRDDSTRSVLSTASVQFDKIFSDDDTFSQQKSGVGSNDSYFSIMSLSIGDALGPSEDMDPNNMGPLFDSSVKISNNVTVERVPLKRNGSSDILHVGKGIYDMSVNTISFDDDMQSMAASNNNMSFLQVFDDNDN